MDKISLIIESSSWYTVIQIVIFILLIALCLKLLKDNPYLSLLNVHFLYSMPWCILAFIFLESEGVYIFELERFGYKNYATFYFLIFVFLYATLSKYFRITTNSNSKLKLNINPTTYIITYCILLIIMISFSGLPDFTVQTKKGLISDALPMKSLFFWVKFFISLLLPYYIILSSTKYLKYLFLISLVDTFFSSALSSGIFFLFIPFLIRRTLLNGSQFIKLKLYHYFAIFCIVTLGLTIRGIAEVGNVSFNPLQSVGRVVAQGELFWVAVDNRFEGDYSIIFLKFIKNMFTSYSNFPLNVNFGLGRFMLDVAPNIAPGYVESGVTYSSPFVSTALYYWGFPITIIAFILLFFCIYYYLKKYIYHIVNKELFPFFLLNLGFHKIMYTWDIGAFERINLLTLIPLAIYIVYVNIVKKKNHGGIDKKLFGYL